MKIDLNDYIEVTWEPFGENDKNIRTLNKLLKTCKQFQKAAHALKDIELSKQTKICEVNIIKQLNKLMTIKSNKSISDLDNREDLI